MAIFSITGPFTDSNGDALGEEIYKFKTVTGCSNDNPAIGESIKVYGYPFSGGGGFYLTATEGIISALPNDGNIIVSARISEGNSGGLVIDDNDCMVDMTCRITRGSEENLGVVIPVVRLQQYLKNVNIPSDF